MTSERRLCSTIGFWACPSIEFGLDCNIGGEIVSNALTETIRECDVRRLENQTDLESTCGSN